MSTIYFTYGRFNPPTIGHKFLFDTLSKGPGDHLIAVSRSQSTKKDPLPSAIKMGILQELFPKNNFEAATEDCPDFIAFIRRLNYEYDHLRMFCGQDRLEVYDRVVHQYNGIDYNFKSIQVKSIGNRLDEGTDLQQASSSLMREAVRDDDFETFYKYFPNGTEKRAEQIFELMKEYMLIEAI